MYQLFEKMVHRVFRTIKPRSTHVPVTSQKSKSQDLENGLLGPPLEKKKTHPKSPIFRTNEVAANLEKTHSI
uniref:Uncharacterized protein n=1 Tax=Acrobeloides nanus TaxID=290746 RepID=A0A914DRH5_9BILA